MRKTKRLIKVLAIIATIVLCLGTQVKAAELSTEEPIKVASLGEIINAGNAFISEGNSTHSVDEFATALAPIGSILAGVGIVIFLAVLAIMAIRWITAKPDQKAKLQQQFVGYVISAVVFFGAVGIWNLVRNIMEQVENSI